MERAEDANRAKSEFLANMSHEIRTPMTAVLGFAEILLEPKLPREEQVKASETIQRNGKYLLDIINDILDLSKVEAGKIVLEQIPCCPAQIVSDVMALVGVWGKEKNLVLESEYVSSIPETIHTDPTRLRQILINIVGNAIKFTDTGSVRLITRFVTSNEHEPMLQFDIVDTGIGMTREGITRLFQPFSQADSSTTRRFGGTGLGLVLAKRLAQILGGDLLLVESQVGIGTRFRATVATGSLDGVRMIEGGSNEEAVTVQHKTAAQTPSPAAQTKPLDGLRILLAEDGPDNQRLIAHVLKKAGAEVTVVENGKLAMDAALAAMHGRRDDDPAHPFDVILMDMQMPVMDGYEATERLRAADYHGPIIALTAHAMASDQDKCLDAGCDAYATKPINRRELIDLIAGYLKRHKPDQTADNASTS
jgi:CheY-like chemotaxis protein